MCTCTHIKEETIFYDNKIWGNSVCHFVRQINLSFLSYFTIHIHQNVRDKCKKDLAEPSAPQASRFIGPKPIANRKEMEPTNIYTPAPKSNKIE